MTWERNMDGIPKKVSFDWCSGIKWDGNWSTVADVWWYVVSP